MKNKRPKGFYNRMPLYLKQWRLHRGLTQDELAAESDIPKSTISELENRRVPINERYLYDIADVLDCEPLDLLTWDPSDGEALTNKVYLIPPSKRREAGRILDVLAEKPAPGYEHETEKAG